MNILNPQSSCVAISDPYAIWIIDDFLLPEVADKIHDQWPPNDDATWHGNYKTVNGQPNILEHGMLAISTIGKIPPYIGAVVEYLHSRSFTDQIAARLHLTQLVPDEHMRWSGLRVMLPHSYQLIHSDARRSPESGLRKELTCLLYFNKGYERRSHEGCLEIWNDEMTECVHRIEPRFNRLTVFVNSDTSYHGVPLVLADRRAITFSILKDGAGSERSKALFVPRPTDGDEVREQGLKRSTNPGS